MKRPRLSSLAARHLAFHKPFDLLTQFTDESGSLPSTTTIAVWPGPIVPVDIDASVNADVVRTLPRTRSRSPTFFME